MSLKNHFQNLSLTRQAVLLITLTLAFLLGFFFLFLNENLSRNVSEEMFNMLEVAQEPMAATLDRNSSSAFQKELIANMNDGATHSNLLLYEDGHLQQLYPIDTDQPVDAFLAGRAEQLILFPVVNTVNEQTRVDGQEIYYRMVVNRSGRVPVVLYSWMGDQYAHELQNTVLNNTVYLTILAFLIVLLIFLFWVFSIIRPLNQIRHYIASIKQGKEADLNLNRKDEIGDVASELKTLQVELERQEKAKEEMIHNISHDLKTPIATIKSYSESIKDGIYPYGDLEGSVDVILDNANRLEKKVHNLLYMNRVEYLLSSKPDQQTYMPDIVEEIVQNNLVRRPEIEIISEVDDVHYDGPPESWRVALENIVDNAFRYAQSKIVIKVRQDEMTIYNDGPSIDQKELDTLFKPYVIGRGGRFGLGLSIVSKIAQHNGYRVKARNTGKGVQFVFTALNPKSRGKKAYRIRKNNKKRASGKNNRSRKR